MTTIDLTIYTLALPLTLGLVQVAKDAGMASRWAGVAAVVIGALAGLFADLAGAGDAGAATAALSGLVAGLSAAGVWSGAKAGVTSRRP
ncbi:MAG TPA: hypothetical protein PKA95_16605 [Thermomicrobiales bacterium]|nr:hypothetical protein [Thermomicrobiales bacterium]